MAEGNFLTNFFAPKSAAPAQAAPAAQQQQGQQQQAQDPATAQNSESSPLAGFENLWQNDDNSQGIKTDPNKIFNVDAKALSAEVGKMNFLGQIPPKVQEALKAGGDDAVKANLYLMNQTAQAAFAQITQLVPHIVETALAKQGEQFESRVSDVVRKNQLSNTLTETNNLASNPAAQPIVNALRDQILQKYPNATPQQAAQMLNDYLGKFAEAVSAPEKAKQQAEQKKASAATDFSAWL